MLTMCQIQCTGEADIVSSIEDAGPLPLTHYMSLSEHPDLWSFNSSSGTGNGWDDFWVAFQFCIQLILWFLSANCSEFFFSGCYQSHQFDFTCMTCHSPQKNKWNWSEVNSEPLCDSMTEPGHPEFIDSHSPDTLWVTVVRKLSRDRRAQAGAMGKASIG